ncbi:phosphatase 2C-like domain-containing protein [Dipodascopsis tothii]|uniref:phosphatase 2C-like domain-containing protein n=1 Tax=Dipodascopsis tothii TaxID=44089 RepID=UPI0034CFA92B
MAPIRLSLLVAAYPTITAALFLAFQRLRPPFLQRIIAGQHGGRLAYSTSALGLARTAKALGAVGDGGLAFGGGAAVGGPAGGAAGSGGAAGPAGTAAPGAAAAGGRGRPAEFSYAVGMACQAKRASAQRAMASLRVRGADRPNSGEDSFFYTQLGDTSAHALGVIDGVGGWCEVGVDATEFSHSLAVAMESIAPAVVGAPAAGDVASRVAASKFAFAPLVLLDTAYTMIKSSGQVEAGGSTACVGVATAGGVLQTANLGDSGYAIVRNGSLLYASQPQTHFFNAPFQLSIIPESMLAEDERQGGRHFGDEPADAVLATHTLRHGDVVMFCTDGLLDNLAPTDYLAIINKSMVAGGCWARDAGGRLGPAPDLPDRARDAVDLAAANLVDAALRASLDTKTDGPFALEAQQKMRFPYRGGKPDDITVLVLLAQQQSDGSVRVRL